MAGASSCWRRVRGLESAWKRSDLHEPHWREEAEQNYALATPCVLNRASVNAI